MCEVYVMRACACTCVYVCRYIIYSLCVYVCACVCCMCACVCMWVFVYVWMCVDVYKSYQRSHWQKTATVFERSTIKKKRNTKRAVLIVTVPLLIINSLIVWLVFLERFREFPQRLVFL